MAKSDRVSVILPHLNQPDYLERTMAVLKQQDYPVEHFEIIVVDNGSTEANLARISTMAETVGFRLSSEPEPGPGPARNKGVREARFDTLAFIDSDCVPDIAWLSSLMAFLSRHRDAAIGGDVRILYGNSADLTALEAYESVFAYRQKHYIEKVNFSGTGNLAMMRSTYEKVGPFRGLEVAEDREWGQRATSLGVEVLYCPDMIVFHPARPRFEDLCVKWRRHILHDYEQDRENGKSGVHWLARVLMVLASIPVHAMKTLNSDRLDRFGDRLKAIRCLGAIRLFRVYYMMRILFAADEIASGPKWNR